MTTVRRTAGTPKELETFREAQLGLAAQKSDALSAKKRAAGDRLEKSDIADAWRRALAEPFDQTTALYTLLEEVHPWSVHGLKLAEAEYSRQAAVVHSLDALFARLSLGISGGKITPENARGRHDQRVTMLKSIDRLKTAVAAAGPAIADQFPRAQLKAIESRLNADLARLTKTAEAGANALRSKTWSADPALNTLGRELSVAPDYAKTGKGWFHPSSRRDYRERAHDPFTRFLSAARQTASEERFRADLEKVAGGKLEADRVLVETFLREIGLTPAETKGWKPTAQAIRLALDHELFLPLRALVETRETMNKGDESLSPAIEKAVKNIVRHVVEGDYRSWRLESSIAKKQLSGLNAARLEAWKHRAHHETQYGRVKLETQEEDGLGLFWVTKIGGPSHGFDYGGECLLPLLSNARTKAILVDDPRWPHNAAARAYLRLLHREDQTPVLYLEPLQRDFPHREKFGDDPAIDDAFYAAIMEHAAAKAAEMNLPLSIAPEYAPIADRLKLKTAPAEERLLLRASNGVYEASDTLSGKHDWPQQKDELTEPLKRLWILP